MDEIITAITYHDTIYIFTKRGTVYRMTVDAYTNEVKLWLVTSLDRVGQ